MEGLSLYKICALDALQKWNGKSYEEALEIVRTKTPAEIEPDVYASGSIVTGLKKIAECIGADALLQLSDEEITSMVMNENRLIDAILIAAARNFDGDITPLIVDTLESIHNEWVRNPKNTGKFFDPKRENKQCQFVELEAIGWNEADSDYIFLRGPLLVSCLDFSDEAIRQEFLNREIRLLDRIILHGFPMYVDAYDPIPDQIREEMKKPNVIERICRQVRERMTEMVEKEVPTVIQTHTKTSSAETEKMVQAIMSDPSILNVSPDGRGRK